MARDHSAVRAAGSVCLRPATPADLPVIVAMRNELNDLELTGCRHATPARQVSARAAQCNLFQPGPTLAASAFEKVSKNATAGGCY